MDIMRNQGVGTWELNLAAFLADLNTNQWNPITPYNPISSPYTYQEPAGFANTGAAFDDARALLAFRYATNYSSLASVQDLFGPNGAMVFTNDNIDGYSDGPLQLGFRSPGDVITPTLNDDPSLPWAGADNTNHFYTLSDLFDPTKTSGGPAIAGFTNRLINAINGVSAYERGTYYRLLAQMGMDSAPESGKMNLNYDNLDPGFNGVLNTNGAAAATNFIPWQPLAFFTNAADRMLRAYSAEWFAASPTNYLATYFSVLPQNYVAVNGYGLTNIPVFGLTNQLPVLSITRIPVWVSNRYVYTPAVQRLLQLAANIYDATSTNYYPSVFRPVFSTSVNGIFTNVFITGYTNVYTIVNLSPQTDSQLLAPMDAASLPPGTNMAVNVYGVPWIVGAKKGFPNFNAFSMENIFSLTRKMLVLAST